MLWSRGRTGGLDFRGEKPHITRIPSPLAASPPPKACPGLEKSPAVLNKQCEQLGPEQLLGMSAAWALAGRTAARGAGGWQGGPRSSSSLPEYSWISRCLTSPPQRSPTRRKSGKVTGTEDAERTGIGGPPQRAAGLRHKLWKTHFSGNFPQFKVHSTDEETRVGREG